jgi:hypothetical protein
MSKTRVFYKDRYCKSRFSSPSFAEHAKRKTTRKAVFSAIAPQKIVLAFTSWLISHGLDMHAGGDGFAIQGGVRQGFHSRARTPRATHFVQGFCRARFAFAKPACQGPCLHSGARRKQCMACMTRSVHMKS